MPSPVQPPILLHSNSGMSEELEVVVVVAMVLLAPVEVAEVGPESWSSSLVSSITPVER